jgi:hypothetical protein
LYRKYRMGKERYDNHIVLSDKTIKSDEKKRVATYRNECSQMGNVYLNVQSIAITEY